MTDGPGDHYVPSQRVVTSYFLSLTCISTSGPHCALAKKGTRFSPALRIPEAWGLSPRRVKSLRRQRRTWELGARWALDQERYRVCFADRRAEAPAAVRTVQIYCRGVDGVGVGTQERFNWKPFLSLSLVGLRSRPQHGS